MAASMNIVANTDGKKTEINQLIELKAELDRVKADLADELDRVNAETERLRAFNASQHCDQRAPATVPATASGTARQLIEHLRDSVRQL